MYRNLAVGAIFNSIYGGILNGFTLQSRPFQGCPFYLPRGSLDGKSRDCNGFNFRLAYAILLMGYLSYIGLSL